MCMVALRGQRALNALELEYTGLEPPRALGTKPKLSPLQEQQVFLGAEPCLQDPNTLFQMWSLSFCFKLENHFIRVREENNRTRKL